MAQRNSRQDLSSPDAGASDGRPGVSGSVCTSLGLCPYQYSQHSGFLIFSDGTVGSDLLGMQCVLDPVPSAIQDD